MTESVKHVHFMKNDGGNLPTATHMVPSNSQCKRKETLDLHRASERLFFLNEPDKLLWTDGVIVLALGFLDPSSSLSSKEDIDVTICKFVVSTN